MIHIRSLAVAAGLLGATAAVAADLPSRKLAPVAPAASAACLERNALPPDVFGFTTGSDVSDVGAWGAALEYNGAYATRAGSFHGHLGKFQVSTAFLQCFEVGPYLQGTYGRNSLAGGSFDTTSYGAGIELKYKLLGRDTHGVGLTLVVDPNVSRVHVGAGGGNFTSITTALKVLMDKELIANKLYGAINLQWDLGWAGNGAYVRTSNLTLAGALSYQVADGVFLGGEARYLRTHNGNFFNQFTGEALFLGPTFYWQATKQLSFTGAVGFQAWGRSRFDVPGANLNLATANQTVAKFKIGYSF
ncbi:MAG: hypothetical protein ACRCXM_09400 [Beijerinckiaceae bacterium]